MGERAGEAAMVSGKAVFQVLDVNTAIFSVPELTDRGNRVVFEKVGGYIQHLTTDGFIDSILLVQAKPELIKF